MRGWRLAAVSSADWRSSCSCGASTGSLVRRSRPGFPHADKLEHAVGFALPVLLILLTVTLRWRRSAVGLARVRVAIVVVRLRRPRAWSARSSSIGSYRHRTGDPFDVLADWAGIAVGVLVLRARSSGAASHAAEVSHQRERAQR